MMWTSQRTMYKNTKVQIKRFVNRKLYSQHSLKNFLG